MRGMERQDGSFTAMAWTEQQRALARQRKESRRGLRYDSDMTDAEWARVAPHVPPQRGGGRHRTIDMRAVVDTILYVAWTGCHWNALPGDLVARSTAHGYFSMWIVDGTLDRILFALVMDDREDGGHGASPTLAIVDSQSVKSGGFRGGSNLMKSGWDGGKKILGAKRHALVDKLGNLLGVVVTAASADERTVGAALLARQRSRFPFLELVPGDGGYSGPAIARAVASSGCWRFEVEKLSDAASGFKPNRRWPVERTFALLGQCRRLARNYERYASTAEAWFKIAMIRLLLRRTPATA